jgi:hypothetical protein
MALPIWKSSQGQPSLASALGGMMKRVAIALAIGGILAAVTLWGAAALECEFPFWPTLWVASRARVPAGTRVSELLRIRSADSYVAQHWHHCTWCDVVYPHAPHSAVKVTINTNEMDFYLFDWDLWHRRLLPASVRTAKLFPELIPGGCLVEPLHNALNPQLYHSDGPCRIVTQPPKK